VDHSNYDLELDEGDHTTVATEKFTNLQSILGSGPTAPVLFNGIALAVNEASPYVMTVLSGSKTSYSYAPFSRFPATGNSLGKQNGGTNTRLVVAVQMKNNARVVFAGSSALFSDRYIQSPVVTAAKRWEKSGNGAFVSELSKWNFQDRSLLRATELTHNAVSKSEKNPRTYRISDELEFSVRIEEYDGATLSWKPFTNSDVQLEFVMMDPYVRTTLKHNGRGYYTTRFQVPDTMGVYKFRINYKFPGYSYLDTEAQVAVRPFRHDEYERFLPAAYPYYAGAFSMMAGFFLFSLVFLYQKE
jgi:oligosaccharyltransferase complex subunit beta